MFRSTRRRRPPFVTLLFVALAATPRAGAQTPAAQPVALGDVSVSGSIRARSYSWDWFGSEPGADYTYPAALMRLGFSQSHISYDWQVELALPLVGGLPGNAVLAAPQGQLGLGASYFAANGNTTSEAALFVKQGYFRWKGIGGVAGQSIKIGRMEFNDGAELAPKNATLAALKRDRISQRLLGTFGFSDVGRSMDGALYSVGSSRSNVTALAARPTQGVFDVNGWPELNINVFYGALTREIGGEKNPGEIRVFALEYDDYRHGVLKTDNRSAAAKAADTSSIAIGTYGGHYLQAISTSAGPIDLLAWGAVQTGSWGSLTQRADAFAAEAGWQPAVLGRVKPWLRAGYDYGSGDSNPNDQTHGTFFQVLPTPRIYARLPFFNMMNMRDAFGELILRPASAFTVRTDVHGLQLASANDLWYSGGGAFQAATFGYTGRPSNGHTGLATLYDVSGDYSVNSHLSLSAYYGEASSAAVAQTIYASSSAMRFAYAELLLRF
jgi:hypothetical protein